MELADTQDLGSCGRPCRFKSCHPHDKKGSFQVFLDVGDRAGSSPVTRTIKRGVFKFFLMWATVQVQVLSPAR